MDKPKELVELFQRREEYDKACHEYNRVLKQTKEAQSEFFSYLYDVQHTGIGSRIIDYIIAAQLLFIEKEDVSEGDLSFVLLNETTVTCALLGKDKNVEIPYNIFSMSDNEYQTYLEKLRDEKVKQKFKEEEERLRKEEIEHYLSLLEHKKEVEKQLAYYLEEYGDDIVLLTKQPKT